MGYRPSVAEISSRRASFLLAAIVCSMDLMRKAQSSIGMSQVSRPSSDRRQRLLHAELWWKQRVGGSGFRWRLRKSVQRWGHCQRNKPPNACILSVRLYCVGQYSHYLLVGEWHFGHVWEVNREVETEGWHWQGWKVVNYRWAIFCCWKVYREGGAAQTK